MKLWSLCLTLGSAFSFPMTAVWAQDNGLKTVDAKGTLEESNGYQLKIKDKAGKELNIFVDPASSTLRYTGTADAKLLSPGMMVRFTGRFDSKGNSQSELKELEIFRPKVGTRLMRDEVLSQTPGIYPVEAKQDMPADKNAADNKNGANGNNVTKNTAANSTNSKENKSTKGNSKQRASNKSNDAKSGASKPGSDAQDFKIVGQITSVQGNKLQINTGSQAFVVLIAATSKIKVLMPDAELGVKGDEVHVIGLSNAAQPDTVQAKIVNITGVKPLAPQQLDNARKPNDKNADPKKDGKTDSKGSGKKPK